MTPTLTPTPTPAPTRPPRTEDEILNLTGEDSTEFKPLIEGLTEDLEKELCSVVSEFERESHATWRAMFREFLEAESFWKDQQSGYYDHEHGVFRVPNLKDLASSDEGGSRFQFVTNIYRALGWTIISILGQKLPTTIFLPADYTNVNDVVAARTASDVVPIIERNNKTSLLHMKAVYHLFTGGIFGGFVRFVADGDRYGYATVPDMSMVSLAKCPTCGAYLPATTGVPLTCPDCGSPVPPDAVTSMQAPTVGTTKQVAKGQEVVTVHGPLELRLPPWVQDQADMPYIGLVNEVHISTTRAVYGDRAKGVTGGFGPGGSYDSGDRFARLALFEPTVGYYSVSNTNLVTIKRFWLRRSALYLIKDKTKREALLGIFSKGAYIAIAEQSTLLDARDESMDDHWRVCRAMEGHGMFTPALGQSAISIQKRLNTLMNFVMEWVEFSAAGQGTFVNAGIVSIEALRKQRRAPGMLYPVKAPAGTPIGNLIHTDNPSPISGDVFRHINDLDGFGQQLTGAVPTVSGGTEQSLKPTTYLADREQALGKMFVPWQHLRNFWSDIMWLGVKCFAANRTDDEKYSIPGQSSAAEIVNRNVMLDSLEGEFDAYPETNEAFPRLWYQQQAMFLQLMQTQDPAIQEILGNVRNYPYAKAMLGMPNLYVPNENDHAKQQLEIAQLLTQQPIPGVDPATGAPTLLPSIPPDEFEDNHLEHMNTVKEWAVSNEGIRAKGENLPGYQNVIAHGKAHYSIMLAQAAQAAPPPEGPGADVAGGGTAPTNVPAAGEAVAKATSHMHSMEAKVAGAGPKG